MQTTHHLHIGDARQLDSIADASVHLVVTSPPYPMISMWDAAFSALAPEVAEMLAAQKGMEAFEAMHQVLDRVWAECSRVLIPGGFLCINIGDATRTLEEFCLYPNHSRIQTSLLRLGMTPLPDILWRKPTNAPNKFMGSGMLPAGAYVTYEHEYILIFRKGGKRIFEEEEQARRRHSAFFWEERNLWFSDLWSELRGTGQRLRGEGLRERSAAFPFELPYRLIQMYSLLGETILDPFAGTGTTAQAALSTGRNSVSYERIGEFKDIFHESLRAGIQVGQLRVQQRLEDHLAFVRSRPKSGTELKYRLDAYSTPVMTRQETDIQIWEPRLLQEKSGFWTANLEPYRLPTTLHDWLLQPKHDPV